MDLLSLGERNACANGRAGRQAPARRSRAAPTDGHRSLVPDGRPGCAHSSRETAAEEVAPVPTLPAGRACAPLVSGHGLSVGCGRPPLMCSSMSHVDLRIACAAGRRGGRGAQSCGTRDAKAKSEGFTLPHEAAGGTWDQRTSLFGPHGRFEVRKLYALSSVSWLRHQ